MKRIIGLLILLLLIRPVIVAQEEEVPTFGEITFALDLMMDSFDPVRPMEQFPAGLRVLVGLLDVENFPLETELEVFWTLDGEEVHRASFQYNTEQDAPSTVWANISSPDGLVAGMYAMNVLYNEEIVASATTELLTGPFVFPFEFGAACGRFTARLFDIQDTFPTGTTSIFAQVRYINFPQNTPIEGIWTRDGEAIESPNVPISASLSGSGVTCLRVSTQGGWLESGAYTLNLRSGAIDLMSGDVVVGE